MRVMGEADIEQRSEPRTRGLGASVKCRSDEDGVVATRCDGVVSRVRLKLRRLEPDLHCGRDILPWRRAGASRMA